MRAAEITSARSAAPAGRDAGARLADVSRILAAVETPRMPPRLVARLDQALAAEAARSRPAAVSEVPANRPG